MERLSERFMFYSGLLAAYKVTKNIDIKSEDLKYIQDLIDAEEQGLLLKLPVAIGSIVYVIDYTYECKFNYDCKLSFDEYKCEEDIRCEHECKKYCVRETRFNHMMLDKIGEKVFLTREEAEQILKQIGEQV